MKDLVKCNYKLLDCGEFEKLEQVDDLIIRRPALQAEWKRKLGNEIWQKYHIKFAPSQNRWISIEKK